MVTTQLLFFVAFFASGRALVLKQVTVLSRHNIRTPLSRDLKLFTPKKWPIWHGASGDLTPKGRVLERAMGKYFSDWMLNEKLIVDTCPKEVFVYSNAKQRTVETAKAFVEGAFGDCVDVHYNNYMNWDPVFNAVIRNNSEDFMETVLHEMEMKLSSIDLKDAFLELDRIVDFSNSSFCQTEHICDLSEAKTVLRLELNRPPQISGALTIGKILVDTFLMTFYDGMSLEDVAWGQIQTTDQWENLLQILNTYNELRFKTKPSDKDVSSTLLQYMADIFMNGSKKFYLLVGHDGNILSLMSSLRFKDYKLYKQSENTPIGGKIVFQKWYDEVYDQDLLRVQYVFQSTEQIREGAEASWRNPPQWTLLELEDCTVNENGFYLWQDFINKLNEVLKNQIIN